MKAYKGMDANMCCRGMQYEIGKTYHVDGEIVVCHNGMHCCESLIDVFDYYPSDGQNRFFEVELFGEIDTDGTKTAVSDMTIIRELTGIEINRILYGYGDGNGNGYGDGYGYGYGDGYGYGYGNGYGNGYGDGDGYGYGYGNGYGDGYGYGNGYGDGNGYGYGESINRILLFV